MFSEWIKPGQGADRVGALELFDRETGRVRVTCHCQESAALGEVARSMQAMMNGSTHQD